MTDPVLYEPSIMETLDCTVRAENTSRLQAGAILSLVDAFDRKLTRDQFIVVMDAALALHTQVGKLYMMESVAKNYGYGVLDEDMIKRAIDGVLSVAVKAHNDLIELMKKVVACPTSQDLVH